MKNLMICLSFYFLTMLMVIVTVTIKYSGASVDILYLWKLFSVPYVFIFTLIQVGVYLERVGKRPRVSSP